MRGNLILIFSYFFFADIFSAAQNCSQLPPNFNPMKVRQCCKLPPIESIMAKSANVNCKDLLKTLHNSISRPVGNSASSNGLESQSTPQSTQLISQGPQSAPPTTLLSNPTTTITAITTIRPITTILPITNQSQQQGTSIQSEQQQRPSQQSPNPGQQQGSTSGQQQGQGQGNQQNGENHVPHKRPSKMPTAYTTPFMCAMECVMNQLQIVSNGKYNKDNADNFLQNILKNDDFTPVLQQVMPDCVDKSSEKVNKFITTYNYTGCNSFGGHYLRCINQEAANNCPKNKWLQTETCNNLQNYIKTCGPPKY